MNFGQSRKRGDVTSDGVRTRDRMPVLEGIERDDEEVSEGIEEDDDCGQQGQDKRQSRLQRQLTKDLLRSSLASMRGMALNQRFVCSSRANAVCLFQDKTMA